MDSIVSKFYIEDSQILESNKLNNQFNNADYQFYEVIRTTDGICIFMEDHLERLKESLKKVGLEKFYFEPEIKTIINQLIEVNNKQSGNIKLVCKAIESRLVFAAYYIPHFYPPQELYLTGIRLKSFTIERDQPNLKQISVNETIKQEIQQIIHTKNYFEVLLVNKKGNITEGSKSNIFFLKGNTVFSAPEDQILKGITRKYVLQVIQELKLNYIEKEIPLKSIDWFDSAIISGTSPKILPIKEIDTVVFNTDYENQRLIMRHFDILFDQYIESKRV